MAIPSEYNDSPASVGATNMDHPTYTFANNLSRNLEESIGPLTNLRTGAVLHPDMHDNDPDRGRVNATQHKNQISTWVPGLKAGENLVIRGNEVVSLTAQGAAGTYIDTKVTVVT